MIVYIGGPIRFEKYRNLEFYELLASIIVNLGFKPYLPHIKTANPLKKTNPKNIYKKIFGL